MPRSHPSLIVLTLVVFGAAISIAADTAPKAGRWATACEQEGKVQGYLRKVVRAPCGGGLFVNANIYRRDIIRTTSGQLTRHTEHVHQCRTLSNSQDVVYPESGVALRHLKGTTWCRREEGDAKKYLALVLS